jgi:spore coat protein CotH
MKKGLVLCFISLFLISCGSSSSSSVSSSSSSIKSGLFGSYEAEDQIATSEVYDQLFDINNKIRFKIDITQQQLSAINTDYINYASFNSKSPIYRVCDLTIFVNDDVYFYNEVGVRMKGNTSRKRFLNEIGDIVDLIHYKFSFNETFDDRSVYSQIKVWNNEQERNERKNRTFAGMEKIDVKWNKNFDATHIKEIYAYQMFNEFGVYAPKSSLAQTTIKVGKGEVQNLGVYNIIEAVDSTFIERNFGTTNSIGDLYKVGWGNTGCNGGSLTNSNSYCWGIEDEKTNYFPTYDLKTNKKYSTHKRLENFIKYLNSVDIYNVEATLDNYLDVDYFIRYEAMSYFLGNPDDMRNNDNNYYLYFALDTGKAYIIPYDFDRTLGINKDWNPTNNGMMNFPPFSEYKAASYGWRINNPIYLKTFLSKTNKTYLDLYTSYLYQIIEEDYFNVNKFNQMFEVAKNNYQDVVMPSISAVSWMYAPFSLNENPSNIIDSKDYNINYVYYITNKIDTTLFYLEN